MRIARDSLANQLNVGVGAPLACTSNAACVRATALDADPAGRESVSARSPPPLIC